MANIDPTQFDSYEEYKEYMQYAASAQPAPAPQQNQFQTANNIEAAGTLARAQQDDMNRQAAIGHKLAPVGAAAGAGYVNGLTGGLYEPPNTLNIPDPVGKDAIHGAAGIAGMITGAKGLNAAAGAIARPIAGLAETVLNRTKLGKLAQWLKVEPLEATFSRTPPPTGPSMAESYAAKSAPLAQPAAEIAAPVAQAPSMAEALAPVARSAPRPGWGVDPGKLSVEELVAKDAQPANQWLVEALRKASVK